MPRRWRRWAFTIGYGGVEVGGESEEVVLERQVAVRCAMNTSWYVLAVEREREGQRQTAGLIVAVHAWSAWWHRPSR